MFLFCRRAGSFGGHGGFGNNGFGISFLSGNFDVGIDGDLLIGGIAAAAAVFFFTTYQAITGRRRKRSVEEDKSGILPDWLSGKAKITYLDTIKTILWHLIFQSTIISLKFKMKSLICFIFYWKKKSFYDDCWFNIRFCEFRCFWENMSVKQRWVKSDFGKYQW